MLVNKIKTHILEMKKKATVEESDIERISSLNNHKINIVKPFLNLRKSNTNTAVFKVVAWLIKKPEKLKEKDDVKLFDLEDPDKYIYKEDKWL